MVLEDSLPNPQLPTTCPSPESDQSNPRPYPIQFREDQLLNYPPTPHICLGLTDGLLPSYLSTTNFMHHVPFN